MSFVADELVKWRDSPASGGKPLRRVLPGLR